MSTTRPHDGSRPASYRSLSRRSLLRATAGGAAATHLLGRSGRAAHRQTPTPRRGGDLTFAWLKYWTHDPVVVQTSHGPLNHIFDALFRFPIANYETGEYRLEGGLAESWNTDDPTAVILNLRQGVRFHDNSEWTADVAKFNLDRMQAVEASSMKSVLAALGYEGAEVVDPATLRINLKAPSPALFVALSQGFDPQGNIVSQVAMEELGEEGFERNPVGSGPYKVEEIVFDQYDLLSRHDGYWRTGADGQPLPYLDTLRFEVIRDYTAQLTQLRAGSIDCMITVQPQDRQSVLDNPELFLYQFNGKVQYPQGMLGFNMASPKFADKRVRHALNHALDRTAIANALGFGFAQPAVVPYWTETTLGWDEAWAGMYPYEPETARQLLEAAGASDLELRIMDQPESRTATVVQQMWQDVGVRVTIDPVDAQGQVERQDNGDFEVRVWQTSASLDPVLTYDNIVKEVFQINRYDNPEMREAMEAGGRTYHDGERAAHYHNGMSLFMEDGVANPVLRSNGNMGLNAAYEGIIDQYGIPDFSAAYLAE